MPDDAVLDTLKFGIGQPVLRTEDPKLLTGRGTHADDYSAEARPIVLFCDHQSHTETLPVSIFLPPKPPTVSSR